MKNKKTFYIIFGIICGIAVTFSLIDIGFRLYIYYTYNELSSASIGIIGGADGPTQIFLSSSVTTHNYWLYLITVILIAIAIFLFYKHKHK